MPRKKIAAAETAPDTVVEKAAEESKPKRGRKPASEKKAPSLLKKPVEKSEEIYLQLGGAEWNIADCRERITAAYVAEGHRASSIKKLTVYLKPEEGL